MLIIINYNSSAGTAKVGYLDRNFSEISVMEKSYKNISLVLAERITLFDNVKKENKASFPNDITIINYI